MRLVSIISSLSLLWIGAACATAVVEDDDGSDSGSSGGNTTASGGGTGVGGGSLIGASGGSTNGSGGASVGSGGDTASGGSTNGSGGSSNGSGGAPPVVTPSCENCKPWSDFSYNNLIPPGTCVSHEGKTYSFMTPEPKYQAECPPAGEGRATWCQDTHGRYQACE